MSVNFGLRRVLLLVGCIVGFSVFGGFDMGWISNQLEARMWLASMIFFLTGSVCVSVIDHETGHMEPRTNLRGAYIVLGILMMAGSCWFLFGSRGTTQ
ncbi:MAG: hypothetical protein KDN22_19535 [Verrucomicrobiae bacterium]|nr:hypothetical protein [Verrucomicrobiae bacterium]